MESTPTILIGLGGLGSSIVNDVYGKIPMNRRDNVAIHAFDTDVNTITKMEHIKGNVTQTSTRKSVGEYLTDQPELKNWFPSNPILNRKTMTEGAGQVRAVSRLAFRSAMEMKKLSAVEEGIRHIFPVSGDGLVKGVRVIIVSSLAGGTGSGIFIQTALYLRWLLKTKFGQNSVLIRGAFLLPDPLVNTGTLDPREWDNVRANAYASVKELNAISDAAMNRGQNVTIELEYRPDQTDIKGRANHAITDKELPFDFSFLYDFENTEGKNLPSLKDYIRQMTDTIYLQIFSPISSKHFSQEDNQIADIIESDGKASYCSAGVSRTIYPYDAIIEYLAVRWSAAGLDQTWLHLDEMYERELKQFENEIRGGMNRERPDKGAYFVKELQKMGSGETANYLFKPIYEQLHQKIDGKIAGDRKLDVFLDRVGDFLVNRIESDDDLMASEGLMNGRIGGETVDDQIPQVTREIDDSLNEHKYQIDLKIPEHGASAIYDIIQSDFKQQARMSQAPHRLNSWVIPQQDAMHPVAVRAFLYDLRTRLKAEREEADKAIGLAQNEFERYERAFYVDNDEFTPEDRASEISQASFFKKKKIRKNFIELFERNAMRKRTALKQYRLAKLKKQVYMGVSEAVEGMIADWERFFDNLLDVKRSLSQREQLLGKQFDTNLDPTISFVMASENQLNQTWETIRSTVDTGSLPDELARQIYITQYDLYCKRNDNPFGTEIKAPSVEELYTEHITGYCRDQLKEQYRDRFDLSVVDALRREAELSGADPEHYMLKATQELNVKAHPYVSRTDNSRHLEFWGIHPAAQEEMGEQLVNDCFGEEAIIDEAFSKRELIRYKAHYGISLHELNKFSSGNSERPMGAYYEAYHKKIHRLNQQEKVITPHLDKNWHVSSFMPDINDDTVRADEKNIRRSFLYGIIFGYLSLLKEDGSLTFLFTGEGRQSLITKNGEPIGTKLSELDKALALNPSIGESIREMSHDAIESEVAQRSSQEELSFYQGILGAEPMKDKVTVYGREPVSNLLDLLITYYQEDPSNPSAKSRSEELMMEAGDLIREYAEGRYAGMSRGKAVAEVEEILRKLKEGSTVWNIMKEDHENTAEFNNWKQILEAIEGQRA